MYGDQFGEFLCGYWGLKGYRDIPSERNNTKRPSRRRAMSERFYSQANMDQNLVESVKCAHSFHTKQAAERYCNPRKYFSSDEEFLR